MWWSGCTQSYSSFAPGPAEAHRCWDPGSLHHGILNLLFWNCSLNNITPRRMLHHNHHLESTRLPHKAVRMTFPVSKSSHAPRIFYSMFSITCVLWKSQSRMGTGWPHRIEPHLEQNCWSAWKLKRSLKRPNKKLLNRGCKDPQKTILNFITCTDGASPCWTRGQRQ